MASNYFKLNSGLYVPPPAELDARSRRMAFSPMMQLIARATVLNEWVMDEDNSAALWNSPVCGLLEAVEAITAAGIGLMQLHPELPESKSWALATMMGRGIHLARLASISLAMGSFSDSCAIFRMLQDRLITIRHLDSNDQYEAFANYSWAKVYHLLLDRLNDAELRGSWTLQEIEHFKGLMTVIRKEHFQNKAPHRPQHYWKPLSTKELIESMWTNRDSLYRKKELHLYELGNRSVHPWIKDLLQPEETDMSALDFMSLIFITSANLSEFCLSRHPKTSHLAEEIGAIVSQTPLPDPGEVEPIIRTESRPS